MKRALLFAAGLLLCADAVADPAADNAAAPVDGGWSSLWRNDDQRGQQLLNHGDAAGAARTYADPRRKAYAELQAGDYAAAAQGFNAFDDSDAHYNRGNALAHGGDLPGALKAYDTALARNPDNQDAKHNRELVEQALRQQQQQQKPSQNSQQKDSQKQDGQQQDKQQQSGQQQSASGQDKNQGQDQKQGGDKQDGAPQKQDQQSAGTQSQQPSQQQSGSKDQAAGQQAQQQQGQQGQSGDKTQPQSADEAQQAQRDVDAGQRQAQAQQQQMGQQTQDGKPGPDAKELRAATPRTEQQLSQEQWLRNIPDDPGGLLRRKFMLEHKMRQQGQNP